MSSFALYKRIAELEKMVLELKKQNEELSNRLRAYENAHTPPSKQRFKKNPPTEPRGKLGAKVGHEKWKDLNPHQPKQ
jgi:hypothetical protein